MYLEAVIQTDKQARVIVNAAGLSRPKESVKSVRYHWAGEDLGSVELSKLSTYRQWKHLRLARNEGIRRSQFEEKNLPLYGENNNGFLKAKYRAVEVELKDDSLIVFPSPHKFFYPLDLAENFGGSYPWRKKGIIEISIRQPSLGDGQYRPWVNAPPKTGQHLDMLFVISDEDPFASLHQVKSFTINDCFAKLSGYKHFSSHYHFWHINYLIKEQKCLNTNDIPKAFQAPSFVGKIKQAGIDILDLAEFNGGPKTGESRLTELQKLHSECDRLWDGELSVLPGEESNCHLAGHWISFFPRPVHWIFGKSEIRVAEKSLGIKHNDNRFVHRDAKLVPVYFIDSANDELKLMEAAEGLMWTAHLGIKVSKRDPIVVKDKDFYQ